MEHAPQSFLRSARPHKQRAFRRQPVTVAARLFTCDMSTAVDCVVRDISPGGALVMVADTASVPDRLYLWQEDAGVMVPCELSWRRHDVVGLKFLGSDKEKVQALVARCLPEPPKVISFGARKPA